MIITAFIISGLLVTGYAMFRGNPSDTPIYDKEVAIPIPVNVLQNQEKESRLRKLVAQEPENPEILAQLGDIYFERGEFFKAVQEYEIVIKLAPEDVDTYNDLGLAYHYTGRPEEAMLSFKTGIENDPTYQRIWLSMGFVQASNGNMDEARNALNKSVEIAPASEIGVEAQRILNSLPQ